MKNNKHYLLRAVFLVSILLIGNISRAQIKTGAESLEEYLPILDGKNIGVVANHTSRIGNTDLIDSLISLNVNVKRIFSPEHGYRGNYGPGVKLGNDSISGLMIISLYGDHRRPAQKDLEDLDLVVFDIQDVGVRFYTYISTMTYMMEECARFNIPFLVLDRPNPNGFYVDGPVLDTVNSSFVGLHPVPVVYGMTIAEYAWMINEEGWLKDELKCDLSWVTCENWDHSKYYELPVKPSPNLPNMTSVFLYPSLCFFEGTTISIGRGSDFPFQVYGHPEYKTTDFSYTPLSIPGTSVNSRYLGEECFGVDLTSLPNSFFWDNRGIILHWLIDAYDQLGNTGDFFNSYFIKLTGNEKMQEQIENGTSANIIRAGWKKEIDAFKIIRKKYLLYRDFE